ncbi:hypothetical protein AJ85_00280 [Alkalihalobacillus alcalophilus ATCC 27647 = CGMCC 1.3604]|uniref:Uncharacterized protein n=1 Tax=Alkalihalobacillus alcalophilus ATCC 27647 = CGMCC 1.3604 TaxID=1218173 RepID=A0A094YYQ5_ALKAL|nr:hypothetical protein [Alkalihalobacillus alcalophilus]KGA98672.1 hypothetical protein BALCAV_0203395 [Alkalihalobacillus alcalophilus ATCC 27647 = CGMCC 1.3604]THG88734.1 hypothetical protein AJ85_00280 [Alkalihalobacillus alcalophilus ATCC 27647 = CGMCC 1.3604]
MCEEENVKNTTKDKKFDEYPKSLKKALRYIRQDAKLGDLDKIERTFIDFINTRRKELQQKP